MHRFAFVSSSFGYLLSLCDLNLLSDHEIFLVDMELDLYYILQTPCNLQTIHVVVAIMYLAKTVPLRGDVTEKEL